MAVGAAGNGFTVTVMGTRGPSQWAGEVWLTYQVLVPGEAVEGVGATASGEPPVATVYQRKPVPVAVSALAGCPWQYTTGLTVGAVDGGRMVSFFVLVSEPQAALEAVRVMS